MTPDFLFQLFMVALVAAATYGAIRKDIENIHKRIQEVSEQANQAHRRIDDILMKKHGEA